ncbi:unnamed protein product [Acanthoscelides obtectus]|uniref:Uncharacterized protein n=1 Tax=Acanthoscelides obtectus TaxID=200917 RepID=A0A9P0K7N2_ACAOB|nr:unnamed protein product [Acanthoscelides obtectus]CAK1673431.1 hypothetical protein AOBTE_LOCUS29336 [Acanthoscelides obtectus]
MAGNPGEIRSAVLGRRASNTENWSTVEVSRNGGNWARSTLRNDTKRSEIAEGQTSDYQNLETPLMNERPIRSNTFRLMTKIANMTKRKKLGKFKLLEEVWQTEKKIWKHKLQEIFIVKSICKKMFLGAISEILANRVNILNKHIIEIYEDVNFPKIPRNLPEILFKQKLNRRFYVKDYSANNFQGNTEKL